MIAAAAGDSDIGEIKLAAAAAEDDDDASGGIAASSSEQLFLLAEAISLGARREARLMAR